MAAQLNILLREVKDASKTLIAVAQQPRRVWPNSLINGVSFLAHGNANRCHY